MMHTINCIQNAIQCAFENVRDANIDTQYYNRRFAQNNEFIDDSTKNIYEIACTYIDDDTITCVCEYEYASQIERELRELYVHANANVSIKSRYVREIDLFHVICDIHYYDDNEHQMFAMICDVNDVTKYNSSFDTFKMINEIEIN